jgi:hypothetical protein
MAQAKRRAPMGQHASSDNAMVVNPNQEQAVVGDFVCHYSYVRQ